MPKEQIGPIFKILSSCDGCLHLQTSSMKNSSFPQNRCSLLNIDLYKWSPSSDCPFKFDNESNFHKEKVQEFLEKEWIKFRDSFLTIFEQAHDFEFENNNYKNEFSFQCYSLCINQLKEFEKIFSDYDLKFAVHDLNNLIITTTKKLNNP